MWSRLLHVSITIPQLKSIQKELQLRDYQCSLLTGHGLSLDGATTHPVIHHLVTEEQRLHDWTESSYHQVATRPQPPQVCLF